MGKDDGKRMGMKQNVGLELNNVYRGDCLVWMPEIKDSSIDMVLTSPPYDKLRTYNDSLDWGEHVWKPVAKDLFRVVKNGGIIVWVVRDSTVSGGKTGTSFRQALYFQEIGFNIHDVMIWEKQTFTDTGSLKVRYGNVFEFMFVFVKGKIQTFNPIKDRENKEYGRKKHGTVRQTDGTVKPISSIGKKIPKFGQRFNVWKINTEVSNRNRFHPAQFPEALARDHILSWSNQGDVVLDPFAGSGTVGKMAKILKRNYILIEKDDEYARIAIDRIDGIGKV